jgi:large repetitive protein
VTVSDAATTADVVLVDTLGAGLTVDSVPAGCVAAGQAITCTLASGAVPGTYPFVYTATVDSDATVSVGNSVVIDEGGGDPDPTCPSCTTDHPVTDAAVTVNKSADPVSGTEVTAGQTIAYTLSVEVSDSATTDAVVLTDTLGAGLTLDAGSLPIECGAVGQVVTCTLASGSLPGNYTFEYNATVDADATISVGNSVEATGGDEPACGTCTTVHPLADPSISVSKSADPVSGTEVSPGQTLTYTLTVTVSDAATTADVVLVDTLGAGLTVDSVPAGCVAAGQAITCTLASGAVPGTYPFVYTATVDSDATVSVGNSVVIDEGGGDPDPACPSCTTDHPVTDASVTVNKSADPVSGTEVTAGQTIAYTLSVEVSDSATTDAVVLTDTLGAGLTLDAGSLPIECGAVGQVVTCTLASGSLPGSYTFEYDATVDADATVSVGNSVEAAGGDDPVCGTCETVHPLADPDVSVAKSADPVSGTEVSPGQTLTYTLTVTVSDAATTADVVLVDTLGAGLTVDSVPAGCVAAGSGDHLYAGFRRGAGHLSVRLYTATVDSPMPRSAWATAWWLMKAVVTRTRSARAVRPITR